MVPPRVNRLQPCEISTQTNKNHCHSLDSGVLFTGRVRPDEQYRVEYSHDLSSKPSKALAL